jgi:hypothetical protein
MRWRRSAGRYARRRRHWPMIPASVVRHASDVCHTFRGTTLKTWLGWSPSAPRFMHGPAPRTRLLSVASRRRNRPSAFHDNDLTRRSGEIAEKTSGVAVGNAQTTPDVFFAFYGQPKPLDDWMQAA